MPADPWADFEEVSPAGGGGADPWAGFEPVDAAPEGDSLSDRWAAAAPRREAALEWLPAIGGAVGGVLGAGGGTLFGMGVGAVPGAVGGAALGGAAGEAARQNIRRLMGAAAPQTSEEAATGIAEQGGVQAAAELTGRGLASAAGGAVRTFLPAPAKQYAQALGATTVANKQISEKIVPELIRRRVVGSREAIGELAEREIGRTGVELDAALSAMPKGEAVNVGAVLNQLQALKRRYVVPSGTPGVNTIVDQAAYNNLGELQKIVASTEPTFESVRRLRQILDTQVTAGDKAFGRTIEEGTRLDATREAANAIRAELAKGKPSWERLNKEFSFWKNVDRVVSATLLRTGPQATPLGQTIAQGVATPAVTAAAATGNPGLAATIAIPVVLRRVIQSPTWRTFSAVQKDRLADAIARGDAQQVAAFLAHSTEGLWEGSRTRQDGLD